MKRYWPVVAVALLACVLCGCVATRCEWRVSSIKPLDNGWIETIEECKAPKTAERKGR